MLIPFFGSSQSITQIYEETRKFGEIFVYGDRDQDIGLKFGWKSEESGWTPVGNGFEFLSETLHIKKFEKESGINDLIGDEKWYIKKDFTNIHTPTELSESAFETQGLIKWVNNSDTTVRKTFNLNIILLPDSTCYPVIPYNLYFCDLPDSLHNKFEFIAIEDTLKNDLIFRVTNLLADYVDIRINNRYFPASPVGWCFETTATPGNNTPVTKLEAIKMDGGLTIQPYSFSLYVFTTKFKPGLLPDIHGFQLNKDIYEKHSQNTLRKH